VAVVEAGAEVRKMEETEMRILIEIGRHLDQMLADNEGAQKCSTLYATYLLPLYSGRVSITRQARCVMVSSEFYVSISILIILRDGGLWSFSK
jgi:hypothetical protein